MKRSREKMNPEPAKGHERKRLARKDQEDSLGSIGSQFSVQIDLAMPVSLPVGTITPVKRTDLANTTCAILCGLCGRHFSARYPDKLRKHLNDHCQELESSHKCRLCQIGFTHKSDLQARLRSAKTGNRGFMFEHKFKCTGHHPPSASQPADSRWKVGSQITTTDDDRFDFCFRLRQWESFQLTSYRDSIDIALTIPRTGRNAITEICTTSESGSHGCRSDALPAKKSPWVFASEDLKKNKDLRVVAEDLKQAVDAKVAKESNDALIRAVVTGNSRLVSSHIAAGADVHAIDLLGFSCVNYAIMCSWPNIVDLLLNSGAVDSITDLCNAIEIHASIEVIERLITASVSVNCPGDEWPVCWSPLHAAVKARRTDIAALLLRFGVDVHHKHVPLRRKEDLGFMAHSLEFGEAHINTMFGSSPMAGLTLGDDDTQNTSLHLAVATGDLDMVKLLLAHGAYVDEGDSGGMLLFLAAWRKDRNIERELRARGASAEYCICGCNTPIVLAAEVMEALCYARDHGGLETTGVIQLFENRCKLLKRTISSSGGFLRMFQSCDPGHSSDV